MMRTSLFLLVLAAGLAAGCAAIRDGFNDGRSAKDLFAQKERWGP